MSASGLVALIVAALVVTVLARRLATRGRPGSEPRGTGAPDGDERREGVVGFAHGGELVTVRLPEQGLLGDYQLLEPLGRSGTVFWASFLPNELPNVRHGRHASRSALRLLPPQLLREPGFEERFRTTWRRVVAGLEGQRHLFVELRELGIDRSIGIPWIVTGYCATGSLARAIRAGSLSREAALDAVAAAAEAVAAAHARGVVHGRLRPECLLSREGRWLVADFELRGIFGDRPPEAVAGVRVREFLAPEVTRGETPGVRSDVYSLGAIACEALAGRGPLTAARRRELLADDAASGSLRHARGPLLRALADEPRDRWSSVADLAAALESVERQGEPGARPPHGHSISVRAESRERPATHADRLPEEARRADVAAGDTEIVADGFRRGESLPDDPLGSAWAVYRSGWELPFRLVRLGQLPEPLRDEVLLWLGLPLHEGLVRCHAVLRDGPGIALLLDEPGTRLERILRNDSGTRLVAAVDERARAASRAARGLRHALDGGLSCSGVGLGDVWVGEGGAARLRPIGTGSPSADPAADCARALAELVAGTGEYAERCGVARAPPETRERLAAWLAAGPSPGLDELIAALDALAPASSSPSALAPAREADADALNNRGVSLANLGLPDQAAAAWREAVERHPGHSRAIYNGALAAWRRGHTTDMEALGALDSLSDGPPEEAAALRALIHIERGDLDRADELIGSTPWAAAGDLRAAVEELRRRAVARRRQAALDTGTPIEDLRATADLRRVLARSPPLSARGHRRVVLSLWRREMERPIWAVDVPPDRCSAAGVSADGRTVLAAGWGGCVTIDADGAADPRTPAERLGPVVDVDVSADGRFALIATRDAIHRQRSEAIAKGFRGAADSGVLVTPRPDALYPQAGEDRTLYLWDLASPAPPVPLRGHLGHTTWVRFGTAATEAVSATIEPSSPPQPRLRFWDLAAARCARATDWGEGYRFAISPDRRHLAVVAHGVAVFESSTGTQIGTVCRQAADQVVTIAVTDGGRWVVTAHQSGSLRLWEVASARCVRTLEAGAVTSLVVGRRSEAVSGSRDGKLCFWDLGQAAPPPAPFALAPVRSPAESSRVASAAASLAEDVRSALASSRFSDALALLGHARSLPGLRADPGLLDLLDALSRRCPRRALARSAQPASIPLGGTDPTRIHLSADGRVALVGRDLLELGAGQPKVKREAVGSSNTLGLSADGRFALACGIGLTLWDTRSARLVAGLDLGFKKLIAHGHLSAKGRWALVALPGGVLGVWDMTSGHPVWELAGHSGSITGVCCNPASTWALTGSEDGTARLWDLAAGRELMVLAGHRAGLTGVALDPYLERAVTASLDGTIRSWKLPEGRCEAALSVEREGRRFGFSLLDRWLFVAAGKVSVWDRRSGERVGILDGAASRSVRVTRDGRWALLDHVERPGRRIGPVVEFATRGLELSRLEWELEAPPAGDWDDRVVPLLRGFLAEQTPHAGEPAAVAESLGVAPAREGRPRWGERELERLSTALEDHGFGWIPAEAVRARLEAMAGE